MAHGGDSRFQLSIFRIKDADAFYWNFDLP